MAKKASKVAKPDQLAGLVQQVTLADLRLVGSRTSLAFAGDAPPPEVEQQISIKAFKTVHENVDHIACILSFRISAEKESKEDQEVGAGAFLIEASFALAYAFKSLANISDEQIQEFGQRNELYNAWPYWREFVQTMTARMGLPALKIPLLRPRDLKFEKSDKANSGNSDQTPGKKSTPPKKQRR